MARAKQISLNNTLIDIGSSTKIWNVVNSSSTYSITGHTTPFADMTTALSNGDEIILRMTSDGRLFYLAGKFGTGSEERYSFTYNEATERRVIAIYSNNSVTYATPAGGAPQFHRSTETTYGIGSENYYGHNKVINNLTTASYTEGESLSAYQGKVLNDNKAPTSHASSATTYGVGTSVNYGHLKIANNLSTASFDASAPVALSAYQGKVLNDGLSDKAPTNHQSTTTDYGVGTAAAYGHVKVANNLSTASFDADAPVVLSAYQGKLLYDGKAPKNHKSTTSDYGLGSGTEYGHVKVINNVTTSSYSAGDALAAYQGKVLQDGITAVTPTLPSLATIGKSNQSITSATDTNMGSFTLTAGLWLVVVTARWNTNVTGIRQVWLASSSTGSALNYSSVVSHQAANGAITSEQLTVFLNVTASTTYHIVVRQSSGSALTCNTSYSTCRLGDA